MQKRKGGKLLLRGKMLSTRNKDISAFRHLVWDYFRRNGRHALPWRKTKNPYHILVSEIMLQQTQVSRVIPFYVAFVKRFPTVEVLVKAPLSDVLKAWQGLGYNRRAKYLHGAAKIIVAKYASRMPRSHSELTALPGIGAYTASAVRAFSWNEPDVFLETNIRTVFIYHFFSNSQRVSDSQIIPLIRKTIDPKKPREWYWALMDYGAYLKQAEGNASRRSKGHQKQKPFKGSDREIRGAILRALAEKSYTPQKMFRELSFSKARFEKQLAALDAEGMIERKKNLIRLAR